MSINKDMQQPVISIAINKLYMIVIGCFFSMFSFIVTGIASWSLYTLIHLSSTYPLLIERIDGVEEVVSEKTDDRIRRSEVIARAEAQKLIDLKQNDDITRNKNDLYELKKTVSQKTGAQTGLERRQSHTRNN